MDEQRGRLQRAAEWIEALPWWLRVPIVFGLIVLPLIGLAIVQPRLIDQANTQADEWLQDVRHFAAVDSTPLRHPADMPEVIAERLDRQLAEVRGSARYHLLASRYFFARQYMFVTIATITAVIAGVLLVPVSWRGLKQAPWYLVTPFLLFAAVAALFTTLNGIYQPSVNMSNNTRIYFAYLSLEDELMSYYPRVAGNDSTTLPVADLVKHVDVRLAELRSFAVGFDQSQVPDIQGISGQISVGGIN